MSENVVIVGSGPAGWSAAIYCARANLKPLVFEGALTEENQINGTLPLGQLNLTTEVENYAGFPSANLDQFLDTALDKNERMLLPPSEGKHAVTGPELMHLMRQQARNFGTRIVTDDVARLDLSTRPFKVYPLEGEPLEAKAIIIATGARANYLGLESEAKYKNRGVSACAVCDGALPMFRNQPLVVVGGGDSAVEEATYLTNFASRVYLIHRRDTLRASKIMADRATRNEKIEIVWNHQVVEVLGDETKVTGVRLENTVDGSHRELACGGMFAAIGHTPNTSFLKGQVETNEAGYIRWVKPFRTWTSVEGVFAAGDVADDYYRQAITSAGTGCMAALDAERWLAAQH
ncbi:MAG TPA: thioredoxin-disulfide reductase [Planctomycetaceae bacterium]|nr:thioredoxin-disulfide reductase [Planctomycetaceae bacterium]HRF01826.1 thioredoxin-disulfide reductase [Pirellulaceae bacterium]